MIASVEQPIALAFVFIWIGLVCAISFLEAWLKFRAPGVTLQIGLGIGRLIFNALNKVEWACALIIAASAVWSLSSPIAPQNIYLTVVLAILVAQTFWLLPMLEARAGLHLGGNTPPPSNLHLYFVAAETLKIICLAAAGISMFKIA